MSLWTAARVLGKAQTPWARISLQKSNLHRSSLRLSTTSKNDGVELWWPDKVEMIKTLPEISEAKELYSEGKLPAAQSCLLRAKDICESAFGPNDAATATVLIELLSLNYLLGDTAKGLENLSALRQSSAVTDDNEKRDAVNLATMKLMLDMGKSENFWTEIQKMKDQSKYSVLFNSTFCLVDLLWNLNAETHEEPIMNRFEAWSNILSFSTNDHLELNAQHLHNMGTAVWLKFGNSDVWETDSPVKEFVKKSLKESIDSVNTIEPLFLKVYSCDEEEAEDACAIASKANHMYARRYALSLNVLAMQNPKEEESQLILSKALKLVQDRSEESEVHSATLAVVLGSLARSLHLNGKALTSEGLYRSSVEKLEKMSPQRTIYKASRMRVLTNYKNLMENWENREVDAVALGDKVKKLNEDLGSSRNLGVELDGVCDWDISRQSFMIY